MIFKETEYEKVLQAIEEQPHKFIRLVDNSGKVIIPFNGPKIERTEHFNRFFISFLTSENTAPGLYTIEGKHTGKSGYLILAQIDKKNGSQINMPVPQNAQVGKNSANIEYIEDNAELRSQIQIYTYQLSEKDKYINELEETIEELNEKIEEINKEEEDEKKPMLSESAQMIMDIAKPFIPLAQGIAMHLLSKYMPPQQPQTLDENGNPI